MEQKTIKILLIGIAVFVVLLALQFGGLNVSANIDTVLIVEPGDLAFGVVFPQEKLDKSFTITINNSLADTVNYEIKHKPKPKDPVDAEYCLLNSPQNPANPNDPYYIKCYPDLCRQLYETPDGSPPNDTGVGFPHLPDAKALGHLDKLEGDTQDSWIVNLVVPCFVGNCGQGYNPLVYGEPFPASMEGQAFGCDLWVEVMPEP